MGFDVTDFDTLLQGLLAWAIYAFYAQTDPTITQTDLDNGSVTNVAFATGTDPQANPVQSPPDDETVTAVPAPALTIVKTADPLTYSAVGDVISYSFLVTNTGNVTIDNLAIDDDKATDENCGTTTLAPTDMAWIGPATSAISPRTPTNRVFSSERSLL